MMKCTTKVGLGLFAAWAIHDFEELCTMSENSKQIYGKLPKKAPIPQGLRRAGMSQKHVRIGTGCMALVMGTAAVLGVRSEGRATFLALWEFPPKGRYLVVEGYRPKTAYPPKS